MKQCIFLLLCSRKLHSKSDHYKDISVTQQNLIQLPLLPISIYSLSSNCSDKTKSLSTVLVLGIYIYSFYFIFSVMIDDFILRPNARASHFVISHKVNNKKYHIHVCEYQVYVHNYVSLIIDNPLA